MIVDDDANTIAVLATLLGRKGHAVTPLGSGADAIKQLQATPFDVLITDLVMPEMGGRELVQAATSLDPAMRCFIMSGHGRPDDEEGATIWIDKPIEMESLLELLNG